MTKSRSPAQMSRASDRPTHGGRVRRAVLAWVSLLIAIPPVAAAGGRMTRKEDRATVPVATAFEDFWRVARDRPFEEQLSAWDRLIESPREELYASAVWEKPTHPNWREQKRRLLEARFGDYRRLAEELPKMARAVQAELPGRMVRFRRLFPDAPLQAPVQLVLAPNFDAKSGLLRDGSPVLVLSVDSLLLEHADLEVLFPHELFHLYQARRAGIENDGVMRDADLTLPLFAEGLATYVSALLAPGHSDGELLLQENLGKIPIARLPEIARRFLKDASAGAADPAHPEPFKRWFNAGVKRDASDLPDRTGYWLGLQVVRELKRTHSLRELASWSPQRAQRETRAVLGALGHVAGRPSISK